MPSGPNFLNFLSIGGIQNFHRRCAAPQPPVTPPPKTPPAVSAELKV